MTGRPGSLLVLLAFLVAGCVSSHQAARRTVEANWTGTAQAHENAGALADAISAWWVVHAVSSSPAQVSAHIQALESRLQQELHTDLVNAYKALHAGQLTRCRHLALAVLRRDPGNPEAQTLMRALEKRRSAARAGRAASN